MLLQQPQRQQQSPREQNLSSYATHLQQLSAHLDDRARALQASESRLAASRSDLSAQRHALHLLETRTRNHITHLLRHIHQRQAALVSWERTAASAKKSVSRTLSAVDTLLSDAKVASLNLTQITSQHETLKASVEHRKEQLTRVQSQLKTTAASHNAMKADMETIARDKQTISRSADKLQSLEQALRARETQLTNRERLLAEQQLKLDRLQPLETLSAHLQAFLDKAAASSLIEPVSVNADMAQAVNTAVAAIHQLQHTTRDLQTKRRDFNTLREQLKSREAHVKNRESELNSTRAKLDRKSDALQLKDSELSASQTEINSAWSALDEARKELDGREEQFREKERSVDHLESRLRLREAALSEREKAFARRERSIRRAHSAVSSRERSIEAREKAIQIERTRLTDISKSIDVRENTLETREFELTVREANHIGRPEPLVQRSCDHPMSSEKEQTGRSNSDPTNAHAYVKGLVENSGEETPGNDQGNAAASSIRRQLAFDDTSKHNASDERSKSPNANRTVDEDDMPDDESDAAAEQLLPELVGARSYWRERVDRLDRIVQSMCSKSWAKKPHVLPILTSVAEGLLTIRRDIDEFPRPSSNSTPKNAYLQEQACQIQWRDQMKQHFDTVREIQAGLLIRLNREESGTTSAEKANRYAERSGGSSNTAESSVDATLDVTLTGDLTRDMLRRAVQRDNDISLYWKPSQKQVTIQENQTRTELGEHAGYQNSGVAPVAETDTSMSTEGIENHSSSSSSSSSGEIGREEHVQSASATENVLAETDVAEEETLERSVLQELASLRDDLENVRSLDATE